MPVRDFQTMFGKGRRAAVCHRLLPICAALSVWPALALAQSADAGTEAEPTPAASSSVTLETVVITAERRLSTVQKTPISITAVSGAQLKEKGLTSVADLMRDIPGLSAKGGGTGQTDYTIRGLSSAAGVAPTVGFYLDDVPLGSPTISSGGKSPVDPDLYDLARVEVLRGPQGTLYGASSMGGTIKLVPESPMMNVFKGSAQVVGSKTEGGGLNVTANAAINIPLIEDVAAMRLVLTKKRLSGWMDRVSSSAMPLSNPDGTRGDVAAAPPDHIQRRVNDTNLEGVRASLVITPTRELTITPTYLYQGVKMGGSDTYDADPGCCKHYQPFNIAEPFKDSFSIASVKAEYDFDAVTLTSVTAYSKRTKFRAEDETEITQAVYRAEVPAYSIADGGLGPVVSTEFNRTRQFTQEFRLSSNSEGPLRWIGGVFFSRMISTYQGALESDPAAATAAFGSPDLFHQTIEDVLVQKALFANVSYDITKDLKITGGTRYFKSTARDVVVSAGVLSDGTNHDEHATSKGSTPMVNLSYNLSPTSMVYSTAAKGYREGSAQPGVGPSCAGDLAAVGLTEAPVRFNPDTVWSYEAGSKNLFFDNALTVNVAAYTQKWSKVQRLVVLPTCQYQYTDNAGGAEAKGFELEAGLRVAQGLSLNFAVGHVKAVYTADDARTGTTRGQKLDGVAAWSGSSSIRYETPVRDSYRLLANLALTYTGSSNITVSEPKVLPSYTLIDARIGLKSSKWTAMLFANNLTNRHPVTGIVGALTFNPRGLDRYATTRPRTIGFDVSHEL